MDEERLLRRYAAERSPLLREQLVHRFMPLARSLAARYRGRSDSFEDLVQVASLGLLKAIDGFDPARGRPFTAYAVPTILGELRRHFRDHSWSVRLPRGLQELTMRVDATAAGLTEELGRAPTAAEIADSIGISNEEVLEAIEAGYARRTLSLDAPRLEDEDRSAPVVELIGGDDVGYDRVEAGLAARAAGVDELEWRVLRLRFVEELTQREIADRLGCSQMQVSRISRRALWKLLNAVRGQGAAEDVPESAPWPGSGEELPGES